MKNLKALTVLILTILLFSFSCKEKKGAKKTIITNNPKEFSDKAYVLNASYKVGDVRRYGIFPDSSFALKHPFTNKDKYETVFDIAENNDVKLFFPKGIYKTNLKIVGRDKLSIKFDNAEFTGIIQIIEKDTVSTSNINFSGNLTSYDGFFVRKSHHIQIENLLLKSDVKKSLSGKRNKGCKIYAMTDKLTIKYLKIDDLGSGENYFKYNNSALAIEGWNSNPTNISIEEVYIKSSDRHGVYMTGTDNEIKKLTIEKFGVGLSNLLAPMEDAAKGEEKEFTGLWMNKCDYCFVDNVTINEAGSKGVNTVFLDSGSPLKASEIGKLTILNDNTKIGIKKDPKTNIELVETIIK